ncbi:hypothetical protein THRCLA_04204 [Thraustotheca clavata]|uniref:Uncharacterized protein n=1 Tax=Thraustotheca clavata TaxID=74557 RepID=A0A1V9ZZQ8_9STRA|nr:hypothetical protein THRCLA_04204 [Thraustotheca clavata]
MEEELRHERVQSALEQMNEISISKIHKDAAKRPKVPRHDSLEERIDAIIATTRRIAQQLQEHRSHEDEEHPFDDDGNDEFAIMDDDAHASMGFKRQLSRFLNLPRSLSHREMEEVTHFVLNQVQNTPDQSILMHEIGTLIDEHVITPRDFDSDDHEFKHRPSLAKRRQAQRKMFASANRLKPISMRGSFGVDQQRPLSPFKSNYSFFSKPSERTLLPKLGSCKSPKMSEQAEVQLAEQKAKEAEAEWRDTVKQDYIIWLRAKAQAQANEKKHRHQDNLTKRKHKPRWLLLYENARAHQVATMNT